MTEPNTHGFFVAIPRLTSEGMEQVETISTRDPSFTYMGSDRLWIELVEMGLATNPVTGDVITDVGIAITSHGTYCIGKMLDSASRLARCVLTWTADDSEVPSPVLELIASSPYAAGLDVRTLTTGSRASAQRTTEEELVVEVAGSTSDFEYQLPASPKYFVGRKDDVREFEALFPTQRGSTVVLNAQSGWGKSSLALKLKQAIESANGVAAVFDTRTASTPNYIPTAIRDCAIRASRAGLISLPPDCEWGSLAGAVRSLSLCTWQETAPLLIFFDQFENAFRDGELTRGFRNLSLAVREVRQPVIIGFAWKTDLVGWTEAHPYQLRDEIRSNAHVFSITPLGAGEVDVLLRRLEREIDQKMSSELRRRIREYSQGLPWLFKKLAGHVIQEVKNGLSQEQLIAEALNVHRLFENDLAELHAEETGALRFIARYAPVTVVDVLERTPAPVIQSLLDRRLVVQVGEKLDTYWDIFRDFLNSGRVPIEDSYIVRMAPQSVASLMREVVNADADADVGWLARKLKTSTNVIFNLSRDLRLFGVLAYAPNRVRLIRDVWEAEDPDLEIRQRIASALRRHRGFSLLTEMCERHGGSISLAAFSTDFARLFPAVDVAERTWRSYARAFAQWTEYAGLVRFQGNQISILPGPSDVAPTMSLLSAGPVLVRARGAFPQSAPGDAVGLIQRVAVAGSLEPPSDRKGRKTLRELVVLGVLTSDEAGNVILGVTDILDAKGEVNRERLLDCISDIPGGREGVALLRRDPRVPNQELGRVIAEATGSSWEALTQASAGSWLRSWLRVAGWELSRPRRTKSQGQLWEEAPEA